MAPDILHFILVLLLAGTLVRLLEYWLAANRPSSLFYKYLVFAY